jgi:hypothetical protein
MPGRVFEVVVGVGGFVWVTAYLVLSFFTFDHLRKNHPDVWAKLGEPSLLNLSPRNSCLSAAYLLFGSDYRSLTDTKLDVMVIFLRLLGGLGALSILTINAVYGPNHTIFKL